MSDVINIRDYDGELVLWGKEGEGSIGIPIPDDRLSDVIGIIYNIEKRKVLIDESDTSDDSTL